MALPDASTLASLAPRERWFLHALVKMRPIARSTWERCSRRLPEWDDDATPLEPMLERFEALGWTQKDEDGDPVPTDAAKALAAEVEAAFLVDLAEWRRRLWARAANHAEAPLDGPVHKALTQVDREACVPASERALAACDMPIPITENMTESAPHAVAMTLAAVMPKRGERVLICGAKGGSLAIAAAQMVGDAGSVTALDWSAEVAEHARSAVRAHGLAGRVEVLEQEDVTGGLPSSGPWQVIILNGSIPRVPYDLMHQLDDADGRILFFLHDGHESSECWVIHKNEKVLKEEKLSTFRFTPIPGRNGFDSIRDLQEQYEAARRAAEVAAADLAPMQTRVPYPLSRSFFAAHNAFDAHERHDRVLKVGEALTKYLGVLAVAAGSALDLKAPRFATALRELSDKPSLGTWLGFLREVAPMTREHAVGRLVVEELDRPWKHRPVLDAYQTLLRETGQAAGGARSVKLRDLLDKLVTYRNKSGSGHGNVGSERLSREIADQLLRALGIVLMEAPLFTQHALFAIVRNERESRRQLVSVMRLQGFSNMSEQWALSHEQAGAWDAQRVVLMKGSERVLDLHPWLVWEEGRNHVRDFFFFNNATNRGQFHYITYHNTDEYPDPKLTDDFSDLLKRFPEPPKARPAIDPAQAQMMFTIMLGPIVADGKITAEELSVLRNAAVQFGLAADPAAAEAWIRELVAREQPGVWFEA
jgi:protein-L-isoaspartate(D-aspartate) O-methyltransferase